MTVAPTGQKPLAGEGLVVSHPASTSGPRLEIPSPTGWPARQEHTLHQKQGNETASTVRHAPKPTERPLAAPAIALIDAVAPSAWAPPAERLRRLTDLRTIPLKTQCNNHPTPLQQNGS